MNRSIGAITVLAFMGVASAPATAAAPPPRGLTWESVRRLPDWSGMWAPGKPPAEPGKPAPQGFGSLFGFGIPLKPKYAEIRDKHMIDVRGDGPKGLDGVPLSNSGLCIPSGQPLVMVEVSHEYLFSPGRATMLLENSEIRRIWTDGRGHPSEDVSNPSFSGHSIGHWEGDTLVVDTVDIFPDAELFIGQHVTDKTHIAERFTRVGDRMRIDTVVTDPELLSEPWKVTRWYDREDREAVDYERCTLEDRVRKGDGRLLGINFDPETTGSGEKAGSGEKK